MERHENAFCFEVRAIVYVLSRLNDVMEFPGVAGNGGF